MLEKVDEFEERTLSCKSLIKSCFGKGMNMIVIEMMKEFFLFFINKHFVFIEMLTFSIS